jgi:hypothetical protein
MMIPKHNNIIVPVSDILIDLRNKLANFNIEPAGFEEIVRQCFDVYMDWKGDEEHVAMLPFFNRIAIPALYGDQYQHVYDTVQHAVHVFAQALFVRLMEHGFFPKSHSGNMDYAFRCFVDNDVMLQHFQF